MNLNTLYLRAQERQIISTTDLRNQQKKYLELAETQKVVVKRGDKLIHLVVHDRVISDEDLKRGINGEELMNLVRKDVKEIFNRQK